MVFRELFGVVQEVRSRKAVTHGVLVDPVAGRLLVGPSIVFCPQKPVLHGAPWLLINVEMGEVRMRILQDLRTTQYGQLSPYPQLAVFVLL